MTDSTNIKNKNWYLYLVRTIDNKLYCGISSDPVKRFIHHCTGKGAKFFNSSKPLALVYLELCGTKSQALKREQLIKQLTKKEKEQLIMIAPPLYKLPLMYNNGQSTLLDNKVWHTNAVIKEVGLCCKT